MDINYLLSREQISLMRAANADCGAVRQAHAGLARGYGQKLADSLFPHRRYQLTAANDPLPPTNRAKR